MVNRRLLKRVNVDEDPAVIRAHGPKRGSFGKVRSPLRLSADSPCLRQSSAKVVQLRVPRREAPQKRLQNSTSQSQLHLQVKSKQRGSAGLHPLLAGHGLTDLARALGDGDRTNVCRRRACGASKTTRPVAVQENSPKVGDHEVMAGRGLVEHLWLLQAMLRPALLGRANLEGELESQGILLAHHNPLEGALANKAHLILQSNAASARGKSHLDYARQGHALLGGLLLLHLHLEALEFLRDQTGEHLHFVKLKRRRKQIHKQNKAK